jgi:branched-chain amino acid transport system substrate-binding protein
MSHRLRTWGIAIGVAVVVASGCGTRVQEEGASGADRALAASPSAGNATSQFAKTASPGDVTPEQNVSPTDGPTSGTTLPTTATGSAPALAQAARGGGEHRPATPGSNADAGPASQPAKPGGAAPLPRPQPGPGSSPSTGAALSPVKVGSIGPRSGVLGTVWNTAVDMTQAWAKHLNARGGLNGHPLDLAVGDDGGDPARHRALVQEFVERRGVIVFLNNFEVLGGAGSVDYLTQKRIPVIGSPLGDNYFYDNPIYFPQGTNGDLLWDSVLAGVAQTTVPKGKKKLATVYCSEVPACKNGAENLKRVAPKVGLDLVYTASASLVQPDYTAECLNASRAGAEIFFYFLEGASSRRLAGSCKRQGYEPTYATGIQAVSLDERTDPNFQGAVFPGPVFPASLDSPMTAEFRTVMARYLPKVEPHFLTTFSWVAAKVLERGAVKLSEPPTNESLLEGLWTIKNDDLGGITQPLTFDRNTGAARVVCWYTEVVEGGKLQPFGGGIRQCSPQGDRT